MADDSPVRLPTDSLSHPLDIQLSEFDAFLEKHASNRSIRHSSPPQGLIYAFFAVKSSESSDATALRACLTSSYLHRFLSLGGRNFLKQTSIHDRLLFDAIKAEFDFSFTDERGGGEDANLDYYQHILKRASDATRSDASSPLGVINEIDPISRDRSDQVSIVSNSEFTLEAAEAARIASLLHFDHSHSMNSDQNPERTDAQHLVVLVPEDCVRVWKQVQRILEWLFNVDQRPVLIRTVVIGRVTFANGWAASIIDYVNCRRKLIDSSYRHKFSGSGGDESNAPLGTRRALTFASICFELMAHPIRRSVTIEEVGYRGGIGGEQEAILPQWARNGVFVMYNYARLCNILEKHNRGVIDGRYPTLAALDTVDSGIKTKVAQEMASLLEWLTRMPSSDFQIDLASNELESKLPNFRNDLFQFSGRFSNYYSKRRVLTESVSFTESTAGALLAKIHVLSRLKRLYLLWFQMVSMIPVEVM